MTRTRKADKPATPAPSPEERLQRHRESIAICWPEWDGPKIEDSIAGRCQVNGLMAESLTHGDRRYHYMAPCRLVEIEPDGEHFIAVIDYDPASHCAPMNGERLRLHLTDIWPPVHLLTGGRKLPKVTTPATDHSLSTPSHPMKSLIGPEEEHTTPATALRGPVADDLFSFREFQADDMARTALLCGGLLGWEPGLGKTMPAFAMPFLWRARYALIVVQADLHQQLIEEGMDKFGATVRVIDSQETAYRYMREGLLPMPGQPVAPLGEGELPNYFITAYNWLGYNGADEWSPEDTTDEDSPEDNPGERIRRRRLIIARRLMGLDTDPHALLVTGHKWRPSARSTAWEVLGIHQGADTATIKKAYRTAAKLWHPDLHGCDPVATERFKLINAAYEKLTGKDERSFDYQVKELDREEPGLRRTIATVHDIETGIGTERTLAPSSPDSSVSHSIKCVFTPTLASIIHSTFQCVACDEAVALKSGTSYQAQGVLRMRPAYRLALTGTPIKNKFPDLFFLCSWVTGYHPEPTARWPYPNTVEGRAQFASDFGVMEVNLTKQEKSAKDGKARPFTKTDTTRICNVHKLWRLLGPVLIRRRKDELPGQDIVPRKIIPLHVMPGTRQQAVYGYHVSNPPNHPSLLARLGAQLTCLRQAALFPANPQLFRKDEPDAMSTHAFTPKTAALLQLATNLMEQGEQLVIASPFVEFSAHLSSVLTAAGIPHLQLDGRIGPTKRGQLIKRFKSGEIPVVILGIKGMAAGHNLDNCHHLALPGLEWALDLNWQIVDRVHRLTSKKDIQIYVLITKGTSDVRLSDAWQTKTDSANLALDGRLIQADRENMNIADFLRQAVADFDPDAKTMDEAEIEANWHASGVPAIRAALTHYRRLRPFKPIAEAPASRRPARSNAPVKPLDRPSVPQLPIPNPAPPRTLFQLMQQRRQAQQPTTISPTPPAPHRLPILPAILQHPAKAAAATGAPPIPTGLPALAKALR